MSVIKKNLDGFSGMFPKPFDNWGKHVNCYPRLVPIIKRKTRMIVLMFNMHDIAAYLMYIFLYSKFLSLYIDDIIYNVYIICIYYDKYICIPCICMASISSHPKPAKPKPGKPAPPQQVDHASSPRRPSEAVLSWRAPGRTWTAGHGGRWPWDCYLAP